MRTLLLKDTLKALYKHQRTVCVEGPPGVGKTTVFEQLAKELNVPLITRHIPMMLVEDFGIPVPQENNTILNYLLPSWFPVKGKAPECGILLFDDRNQGSADIQKVMANICQARTLHGVSLPDGWQVVSTGNRQRDRAGANRVLSHLRNRETVLNFEVNVDDWRTWAFANGVPPEVIAFISFRPGLLNDFDPQRDQNPTPRSWAEGVGMSMNTVPKDALFECVTGDVGEGAAAEFMGFMDMYHKLPDVEKMLQNPKRSDIPKDPITLYALSGAMIHHANVANMDNLCTLTDMMPNEYRVLIMRGVTTQNPELCDTKAFNNWTLKNQWLVE